MHLRYSVEKRILPKIQRPVITRIVRVKENGFGYISDKHAENGFLETFSIFTCLVVYLRQTTERFCAIAHLNTAIDHAQAIRKLFEDLSGLVHAPFDDVKILTGMVSNKRAIMATYAVLQELGLDPRVVQCFPPITNASLYDVSGGIWLINLNWSDIRDTILFSPRQRRPQLVCENLRGD